jgi:hypothetical protein
MSQMLVFWAAVALTLELLGPVMEMTRFLELGSWNEFPWLGSSYVDMKAT